MAVNNLMTGEERAVSSAHICLYSSVNRQKALELWHLVPPKSTWGDKNY